MFVTQYELFKKVRKNEEQKERQRNYQKAYRDELKNAHQCYDCFREVETEGPYYF